MRNQAIYEKIAAEIRDAGYEHACSELQRKLEKVSLTRNHGALLPGRVYERTYYDTCLSTTRGT